MNPTRWVTIALFLLAPFSRVEAHRLPESLTTIEFNESSGLVEIVHRLHAHDAELALKKLSKGVSLQLDTLEGRARLALYVEERFLIFGEGQSEPLVLALVGAELEDDYLYVYQEYDGEFPREFRMRQDLFFDFFPNQVNTVNVEFQASLRTLVFTRDKKWQSMGQ